MLNSKKIAKIVLVDNYTVAWNKMGYPRDRIAKHEAHT